MAYEQGSTGTIYFRNKVQSILWKEEFLGQFSDGHWENSEMNWEFWGQLDVKNDANPRVVVNPEKVQKDGINGRWSSLNNVWVQPRYSRHNPNQKGHYSPRWVRISFPNLLAQELLEVVGDRMLYYAKLAKAYPEKVNEDGTVQGVSSIPDNYERVKRAYASMQGGDEYDKRNSDMWAKSGIDWEKVENTKYEIKDMLNDIREMKKTMKNIQSPAAKKEEPVVAAAPAPVETPKAAETPKPQTAIDKYDSEMSQFRDNDEEEDEINQKQRTVESKQLKEGKWNKTIDLTVVPEWKKVEDSEDYPDEKDIFALVKVLIPLLEKAGMKLNDDILANMKDILNAKPDEDDPVDLFNNVWDEVYDWADENRVWIKTF